MQVVRDLGAVGGNLFCIDGLTFCCCWMKTFDFGSLTQSEMFNIMLDLLWIILCYICNQKA